MSSDDYGTPGDDSGLRHEAAELAEAFVTDQTEFHLGVLPTEGSHPVTERFSQVIREDIQAGIRLLLTVDHDITTAASGAFDTPEYAALVRSLVEACRDQKRICFSGCGSTGRLAMMLEEMWRQFWEDRAGVGRGDAERAAEHTPRNRSSLDNPADVDRANLACSIMTGGDRALVRSVENFEDFSAFGERQVADLGLGSGDLLIAITEGGETPSVLGTAHRAAERGCTVFLVFNNPADVLRTHIDRSRNTIDHPGIISLDLSTGPMALSGSTRMQATTSEMLVVGTAVEEALSRLAASGPGSRESGDDIRRNAAARFADLVGSLLGRANVDTLAAWATKEHEVYTNGGVVTYFAEDFLLDIFCDTSERTPTFMLPPFRPAGDHDSAPSWAYAKDPTRTSGEAWRAMLRRSPRGLTWRSADYAALNAPQELIDSPPSLGEDEIRRYQVGSEEDRDRPSSPPNWWLTLITSSGRIPEGHIGGDTLGIGGGSRSAGYHVDLDLPESRINLWHHLVIKLVFNTVSTATMGLMGRIQGNWMIQLDPTNNKLIDRGSRIVSHLANIPYLDACRELYLSILSRRRLIESGGQTTTSPVVAALQRLGAWRE